MSNRLSSSSSPYLLQHAENPVDWYEWGPEAFDRARTEDKPILLSIGYAACHWCHVMAHESFEDPDTAEVMNRSFVNLKVDREQRPDVDRIYQLAHQLMQRRGGGWPLTAFLDPHTHHPFFVGTYFPPTPRHGLPAFRTVLERVAEWYRKEPAARAQNNEALTEFFERTAHARGNAEPATEATRRAQAALERDFDARHGGFTPAPKFPHTTQLEWLLRRDDPRAQQMARFTLDRMCRGGLFDHLGGGFFRYSVDERWEIPHFEKMAYDNGLMLAALASAGRDDAIVSRAARLTADWAMREMQHPDGGYLASLDADSEGHEGVFYLWDPSGVRELLNDDEYGPFAEAFGLGGPPNFEGRWHLHCAGDAPLSMPVIENAARKLFAHRERRVRPALDDKVLAAWNGLMIRGMAMAAREWRRADWAASALSAARFVHREMWRDGRLVTSWRRGAVVEVSFLDDHAYLLDGLIELLQVEFDAPLLGFAVELAEALVARFEDRERGGFWFTPDDHEPLIQRPKSFLDEATPSGNGVAALALARLGRLVGEMRFIDAAERTLDAASATYGEWPHAHASSLIAAEERAMPPELVVLRGHDDDIDALENTYRPTPHPGSRHLEFRVAPDLPDLPGQLAQQPALDGKVTLYRCVGRHCEAPQVLG